MAALLSLFAPGAGQLYNGQPPLALLLFAIFAALSAVFFFALPNFHPDLPILVIFVLLSVGCLAFQIASAVQAFIRARRVRSAPVGRYQHVWIYVAMLVALPVVNSVAAPAWLRSFYTPSGSNEPSLLIGDRFFVEIGYYHNHSPKRGEMIVFKSRDGRTDYVKRLIGLPGENIQIRQGILYINDQAVPRRRIEDYPYITDDGSSVAIQQYVETLPEGTSYRILQIGSKGPVDNTDVFEVPPGNYFTMGDNRDNSLDSRMVELGYVPAAKLIGRAYIVYWPLPRLGLKFEQFGRPLAE
ncbi:MAG TPA: signal peptidase I [Stellaceae bacterium]|nr:signal peptidase I [Stellaceae bacterium]